MHGQTGPYAEYKSYPLNTYHGGMLGYMTPLGSPSVDREPIKSGGMLGEYSIGLNAAVGTLAALYTQGITKAGQHVDISKQETIISLERVFAVRYPNLGESGGRFSGRTVKLGDLLPCQNGHFLFMPLEPHHWQGFVFHLSAIFLF